MSESWFDSDEELLEQMRETHLDDTPRPLVRGYRDLIPLQRGGQGTVFLALQEKDERRVALKIFHEQSFDSALVKRRFEREIQLVSRLDHPNVVRLYRFGQSTDGRPFLAMEYVAGLALDEHVAERSVEEIVDLAIQICDALDHAHRRGVIHRDLKPANVRVDRSGNARLLDFGLAKPTRRIRKTDGWELSATGQFLGTLRWASPEQLRGDPDRVDTRTDIYSLGLLIFHCLTGRMPYDLDGSVADIADSIEHAAPEPVRAGRPDASADVETILLRCLAKEPARRYASMGELARDLKHARAGEPIEARRDGLGFVLRSLVRKHPVAVGAVTASLLALVAFSIVTTRFYLRARDAERIGRAALEDKRAEVQKVAAVNEFLIGAFTGQGVPREQLGELRLQDVLTDAAHRIEEDSSLRASPDVRADLHMAFAYWFLALPDRRDSATAHANEALRLYEQDGDPPATQVAWALEVRGFADLSRREFAGAYDDLTAARQRYVAADAGGINLIRLTPPIAACGFALGKHDGLEAMLLETQTIVIEEFGPEHVAMARLGALLEHLRSLPAPP